MGYQHGTKGNERAVVDGRGSEQAAVGKQTLVEQVCGASPVRSVASAPVGIGGDQTKDSDHRPLGGDEVPEKVEPGSKGKVTGGDATSISTSDLAAAEWKSHGQFKWWIKWITNGTKGWIVQRIVNTYAGTDGSGGKISNSSVGTTPSYYEAWEVDASGGITGSLGSTGNRDRWERPGQGEKSKGNWSMSGTVYWTKQDPAKSGFSSGGVTNAGSLLSSTSAPTGLSGVLATRSANGTWDSTGDKPTHTGTAS